MPFSVCYLIRLPERVLAILDPEVLPEIVAQSCAVITGFELNDHQVKGMLTGMRNVEIVNGIRSGDRLFINVRETSKIDNYYTLDFNVVRAGDGMLCAKGELSICRL